MDRKLQLPIMYYVCPTPPKKKKKKIKIKIKIKKKFSSLVIHGAKVNLCLDHHLFNSSFFHHVIHRVFHKALECR